MASDCFIKIKAIPGDCTVDGHKDEIEILSWSIGSINAAGGRTAGGSGSKGNTTFGDLVIVKSIDASSNKLAEANWNGSTIPEAILTVQRAGDKAGKKVDYFKLTLKNVLVTSYDVSGSPGSTPTESVSLNYDFLKREYFNTGGTGEGKGWGHVAFDVAKAVGEK